MRYLPYHMIRTPHCWLQRRQVVPRRSPAGRRRHRARRRQGNRRAREDVHDARGRGGPTQGPGRGPGATTRRGEGSHGQLQGAHRHPRSPARGAAAGARRDRRINPLRRLQGPARGRGRKACGDAPTGHASGGV